MKFLYKENQDFKETGILFSEEEVRSHIDHYFKDSHYYFQSFVDRQPLPRRTAVFLISIGAPLALFAAYSLRRQFVLGYATAELAFSCLMFGVFLVFCLLGWLGVLQSPHAPDEAAQKEKGKHKQKFVARRGATKREIAYDHLLETGVLYEGRIGEMSDLTPTVRQITFHFSPHNAIKSGVFVTESPIDLALYDTLVVLSDDIFSVLI
jgi:hypothetical protein